MTRLPEAPRLHPQWRLALRLGSLFLIAAVPLVSQAHDARPLSIAIIEQGPDLYRVVVHAPPTLDAVNAPSIVWPDACDVRQSNPLRTERGGSSVVFCRGGLPGLAMSIQYPVYNPSITTLFRLQMSNGSNRTAVLPPDELTWTVPTEPSWSTVARDYTALGFKHIWEGPDHLLFVAGLMLLARSGRRILFAVTGFTAAHSITLSLAALGFVRIPIAPVEAMIALSILFLAGEIARTNSTSFSHRFPVALSFVFGLLHGFGFASALGEVGLPATELATGLVFFNIGVELGQIAFIAAAVAVFLGWRSWRPQAARSNAIPARAAHASAYALGIPAAFWFIERTLAAFTA
jgi:hydrogenase/urease accessory protein HupE